jgi:hypothetical protein
MDRPSARITAAPAGGKTVSFNQHSSDFSHWLPIREILKLEGMETLVLAAPQQELVMRARLHDGAAIQHDDPVGSLDR